MSDLPDGVLAFSVPMPRHAFSPRDAARAGDVWRACQEVAVHGSARLGWPPSRFRREGCAFVVRSMTAVHHREIAYGEPVAARTWISSFRRGLLTHREIRLADDRGAPLVTVTQEWAHVLDGLRPARARPELVEAFRVVEHGPSASLPAWEPVEGAPEHTLSFRCWHTWMDPLAHANHPAYVDWCDEATSVLLADRGVDPVALAPVAEWVKWRRGVVSTDEVVVRTRRIGRTDAGDVVFSHDIVTRAGEACARAITVRSLVGAPTEALAAL